MSSAAGVLSDDSVTPVPQRPKISGVVTTFNEETNIARCLDSLLWCDLDGDGQVDATEWARMFPGTTLTQFKDLMSSTQQLENAVQKFVESTDYSQVERDAFMDFKYVACTELYSHEQCIQDLS